MPSTRICRASPCTLRDTLQSSSPDCLHKPPKRTVSEESTAMPSSCWAWQGTRSAEGSSAEGELRARLILGLHKMSPFS